jgi:hypothetical protein
MLKHAKVGEALAGQGGDASLSTALVSIALEEVASDIVTAQPALTERLYVALRRDDAAQPEGAARSR